jgi:hypothetical protein
MRIATLSLAAAMACLAAIAGSAAEKKPASGELLAQFCATGDVKGNNCLRAKGYPGGNDCNVELRDDPPVEGRFLASKTVILLARYDSDCEPHATENGGSVVFERIAGGLRFLGYQPGLAFDTCATVAAGDTRDRLVCVTSHMGQGYLESAIAEVVLTQTAGAIKNDLKFFQRATDSIGARGANSVKCSAKFAWFSFSDVKAGPGAGTVSVEASYADAETIRRACSRNAPKVKALMPAERGDAYVDERSTRQGRFVLDLASRALMPEKSYTPR